MKFLFKTYPVGGKWAVETIEYGAQVSFQYFNSIEEAAEYMKNHVGEVNKMNS